MSDRRNDHINPLKDLDRKTRRKYKNIIKEGKVPPELENTKEGRFLKKQIRQNESAKKGWGIITDFLRTHWVRYISGVLSVIFVNVLAILTPIIMGDIIDMLRESTEGNEAVRRLGILCLAIVGIAFGKLIGNFLVRLFILGGSNIMEYLMRQRMFNKLIDLSMNYFNRKSAGEIMALSTNDLRLFRMAIGRGIMLVTNSVVLMGAGFFYLSFNISLPLTLGMLLPFPIMLLLITKFSVFIKTRSRRVQETFADITEKTEENISGIRIIKSFVQEEEDIKNFTEYSKANYRAQVKLARVMAIFHPSLTFLSTMAFVIMLLIGGLMAMAGDISLGVFVAANSFLGLLIRPIRFIGMLISHLQQGRVALSRISELIFEEPDIKDGKHGKTITDLPEKLSGNISFTNLEFNYPNGGEKVFNGISTEISSGSTVAVIGEVGSGKTTLANLLMRIFDVSGPGMIAMDGMDITELPLKYLRDNIGYVPQDNFLFSDTIAYNIGFSEDGNTQEEIEEASIKSNVYGNIIEFPDKFNTMLGEKGVNLSGGQKQRICIARALIKDTPILILDDCLSSVDVETEKAILENLRDVRQGKTVIIISHRVSTIKDADKIVVLKDGMIAEEGSHDELLLHKGIYERMYRMQLIEEMEINGGES